MSLSLEHSQRITQRQRIEQRQTHQLRLRLELIMALREEEYEPTAVCPDCGHKLKPIEIVLGFNRDPNDFNTTCPDCKHRFPAQLKSSRPGSSITVAFYCDNQTQARLMGHEHLTSREFEVKEAAIYHSAVFHNGNLKQAFARIGVDYPHEVITDPCEKIVSFLGKLPDTVIARVAGIGTSIVRRMRETYGISAYVAADSDDD